MSATIEPGHQMPPLFREAFAGRHAAKRVARAAGVPVETARNWLRGRATPSAEVLLRLATTCREMRLALQRILDAPLPPPADPRGHLVPGAGRARAAGGGGLAAPDLTA